MLNKEKRKEILVPFAVLFALLLVSVISIIRANYYYIDDLTRAMSGMKGWDHFSRYISVWLSTIIHTSSYLADISPLTQIIALLFLAAAGIIIVYLFKTDKVKAWAVIATMPIAISPYYLECISYKFDSPYIALSVLASVAPVLLYGKTIKKQILFAAGVIAGTLVMCMTYQASSGIFPMLVGLSAFRKWNDGTSIKETAEFIVISAVSYVAAMAIFKYLILTPVVSYVTTYQAPISSLLSTTINNLKTYFSVIFRDFKPIWLILVGIITLDFIIVSTVNSTRNKILAAVLAIITACFMLLVSFGAYALLEKSFYNPRAMYGFGVYITLISVAAVSLNYSFLSRVASVILVWMFVVFAFTYGNCLYVQAQYTDFRINQIIADLNDLDEFNNDNYKIVKFSGNIGLSPVIENMPRDDYTMLDSLVPVPFGDQTDLSTTGFYYYYDIPNIARYDLTTQIDAESLPILKETMYHTIRGDGEQFLIELK